ncbi:MAG: HEAT repeat domain-containing protein [Nitrospiria bacterium]
MKISYHPVIFVTVCLTLQMGLLGCGAEGPDFEVEQEVVNHASATAPSSALKGSLAIGISNGLLTAEVRESSLREVLETIVRMSGITIFLDSEIDGTVTFGFHNLPLDEGLRRILHKKNASFIYSIKSSRHNKNVISRLERVHVIAGDAYGTSPDVLLLTQAEIDAFGNGDTTHRSRSAISREKHEETSGEKSKEKEAIEALEAVLLKDKNKHQRAKAAKNLEKMQGTDAIDTLTLALLGDDDSSVRKASARALGKMWSEETVDSLRLSLLDDPRSQVRATAAQALGNTWSEDAIDPLSSALLEDPRRRVRESAAQALGNIGSPNAVESLIQALGDTNLYVRESAAQALGRIGSPEAVEELVHASMFDKDPWMRETSEQAVERILEKDQS